MPSPPSIAVAVEREAEAADGAVGGQAELVVVRRAGGDHVLGLVEAGRLEVGAGHVVDADGVDAVLGEQVERLDVVEIHRDVGDVAGEADALAVGGEVEELADGGAVEVQRVGAGLAFDGVGAVARVPGEAVGAAAEQRRRRCPGCRRRVSLPLPPSRVSMPLPPRSVSSPPPPSTVSAVIAARLPIALKLSAPLPALTLELLRRDIDARDERGRAVGDDVDRVVARGAREGRGVAAVAAVDRGRLEREPEAAHAAVGGEGELVVARGAVGDDALSLVEAGGLEVGAGEVVDGDRVGAVLGEAG